MKARRALTNREIFRVPAAIAALSLAGLITALQGEGVYDVASWLALLAPVPVTIRAVRRARAGSQQLRAVDPQSNVQH